MARASKEQIATVRGIWQLHQGGATPEDIVRILGRQRVRMSRYDVQAVIQAAAEQAQRQEELAPKAPADLLSFIPEATPKYAAPRHLLPLTLALEQALARPVRAVVHAPPRHAKTETVLHAISYWLIKRAALTVAYASYAAQITRSKSRKARALCERAGIVLAQDAKNLAEWRTEDGGGLLATSTGGPLTGQGVDIMLVDDPIKGRAEAESRLIRDRIWEWFSDVVMTRVEPGGSVFVVMTRWHEQDLAGRLLKEQGKHKQDCADPVCHGCGPSPEDGYEEIRLPAISDAGEALWAERWPLEALQRRKREVGEYTWSSLYQGRPRRRGGKVFEGTYFYSPDALPDAGFSVVIGLDLNYTESTQADWSVAVALMRFGSGDTALFYVLEVLRIQTTAPKLADELRRMRKRHHGARIVSIYYGTETGTIDLFRSDRKIPITGIKRFGDKFTRAQPCAAAWNDGRILLPMRQDDDEGADRYPWMDPFVDVITEFTGVKDLVDDDVDALTSAYEALAGVGAILDEQAAEKLGAALAGGNPTLAPALEGTAPGAALLQRKREEDQTGFGQLSSDDEMGWCSIE
jgi:predicted phage terminase large subunit-like protein